MPGFADPVLDLVTRMLEAHGLFVYGTLRPGEQRWGAIEDLVVSGIETSVPGRIWDTGLGFPAAAFDAACDEMVPGVRFDVPGDGAEDLARRLLAIEGDLYDARLVADASGRHVTAFEWRGPRPT